VSHAGSQSVWVVRHGETAWSRDGQHTSTTDIPLTDAGVATAHAVGAKLGGHEFARVLTSPLQRARRTAELAGFRQAVVDDDLVEWGYGSYEGVTTSEIRRDVPGWTVWSHPSPGGETPDAVAARVDRVIERARGVGGDVLLFGHSHCLRALTARWLGQPVTDGRLYRLDTATVSVLGYERETPVLVRWNA